jgi:Beta-ketoacyl synthase, N-terminal domain
MSGIYLSAVGMLGPGLPNWSIAREVLGGRRAYRQEPPPQPEARILPPNERRRGAKSVRWAVAAAQEALDSAGITAAEVATVFASSSGDGETLHQMCETLAGPLREVSPTRFHNSVHNAAAGYWSIAAGSRQPSVTLCAHDGSFAAGLIEAAAQVRAHGAPVLLVAYDLPYPDPLAAARKIGEPLAVALLFLREPRPGTLGMWRIAICEGASATRFPEFLPSGLCTNPAAHSLPLLAAVARGVSETVAITYVDGCHLRVDTQPWP